jgi:hypothetical protein
MADTPIQDGRVGKLTTPLGKDKLCLTRFEGTEAIGRVEASSMFARIGANVTETVGGNELINVGPVDEEAAKVGGRTREETSPSTPLRRSR